LLEFCHTQLIILFTKITTCFGLKDHHPVIITKTLK